MRKGKRVEQLQRGGHRGRPRVAGGPRVRAGALVQAVHSARMRPRDVRVGGGGGEDDVRCGVGVARVLRGRRAVSCRGVVHMGVGRARGGGRVAGRRLRVEVHAVARVRAPARPRGRPRRAGPRT